jgi:hypothetical protein
MGILDENLFDQIVNTHKKFPASLIEARDILGLVPARTISKVLMEAREWQLRNAIVERDLVINYIINKDQT